ncbi:MAG: hypothetical protein JSS09_10035, partial [Verrucomicrobia bacterium]|nr:hypothetical protein [Verrucomicrobiota bacterium]
SSESDTQIRHLKEPPIAPPSPLTISPEIQELLQPPSDPIPSQLLDLLSSEGFLQPINRYSPEEISHILHTILEKRNLNNLSISREDVQNFIRHYIFDDPKMPDFADIFLTEFSDTASQFPPQAELDRQTTKTPSPIHLNLSEAAISFPEATDFPIEFTRAELGDIEEFHSKPFDLLKTRLQIVPTTNKPSYTQELLHHAISTHKGLNRENKESLYALLSRFPQRPAVSLPETEPPMRFSSTSINTPEESTLPYTADQIKEMSYEEILQVIEQSDTSSYEIIIEGILENNHPEITELSKQFLFDKLDERQRSYPGGFAPLMNSSSASSHAPQALTIERIARMSYEEILDVIKQTNPSSNEIITEGILGNNRPEISESDKNFLLQKLETGPRLGVNAPIIRPSIAELDQMTARELSSHIHPSDHTLDEDLTQVILNNSGNRLSFTDQISLINRIYDLKRWIDKSDIATKPIREKRTLILNQITDDKCRQLSEYIRNPSSNLLDENFINDIFSLSQESLITPLFFQLFANLNYDQLRIVIRENKFFTTREEMVKYIADNDKITRPQKELLQHEATQYLLTEEFVNSTNTLIASGPFTTPPLPIEILQFMDKYNQYYSNKISQLKMGFEQNSVAMFDLEAKSYEIKDIAIPPLTGLKKIKGDGNCYYRAIMTGLCTLNTIKSAEERSLSFRLLKEKFTPLISLIENDIRSETDLKRTEELQSLLLASHLFIS